MDFIQGYNSDSEEEGNQDQNQQVCTPEETRNSIGQIDLGFDIEDINIYLQNYTTKTDMTSIYLMIPWKPSTSVVRRLEGLSTEALKYLKSKDYKFYNQYNWDLNPLSNPNIRSKYDSLHISLGVNKLIPNDKTQLFIDNLQNQLANLKIPPHMIKDDSETITRLSNLQKIFQKRPEIMQEEDSNSMSENFEEFLQRKHLLNITQEDDLVGKVLKSNNSELSSKCIQLKFQPEFKILDSASSPTLFLGLGILMSDETKEFFNLISQTVKATSKELDIPNPMEGYDYHHISLARAIPKLKVDLGDQLQNINQALGSFNYSTFASDFESLDININCINLITTSMLRSLHHFDLPL